jgi:hypothetical protein
MNALARVLFSVSIFAICASALGNGNVPDDGMNLSFDASTDFEWLDLSLSTSYTYNFVNTQLGPGGLFAGFQRASNADVIQLWTNLGLPTLLQRPRRRRCVGRRRDRLAVANRH